MMIITPISAITPFQFGRRVRSGLAAVAGH
jgi:hypothetical protein